MSDEHLSSCPIFFPGALEDIFFSSSPPVDFAYPGPQSQVQPCPPSPRRSTKLMMYSLLYPFTLPFSALAFVSRIHALHQGSFCVFESLLVRSLFICLSNRNFPIRARCRDAEPGGLLSRPFLFKLHPLRISGGPPSPILHPLVCCHQTFHSVTKFVRRQLQPRRPFWRGFFFVVQSNVSFPRPPADGLLTDLTTMGVTFLNGDDCFFEPLNSVLSLKSSPILMLSSLYFLLSDHL